MNNIVHLHAHNWFSYLDGYGSPESHVKRAKELGMTALATTNHNHLGGCLDFQRSCKEHGIKPLLGVELYYTKDTSILSLPANCRHELALRAAEKDGVIIEKKDTNKVIKEKIGKYEYDTKQFHILFIAKNQTGWNNLVKLQSEAAKVCTYNGRFICDDAMIDKYKEGLIMTTACLGSIVNNFIMKGEIEEAYAVLDKWHKMFGENFYIEIQPLCNEEQLVCNMHLIEYATNNNVKLVATNDVHYANESDIDNHDTLLCIGIGKIKDDPDRMRYDEEFWIRTREEMRLAFARQFEDSFNEYKDIIESALDNTNEVADKVEDDIVIGSKTPILPKVKIPGKFTPEQYLTVESYKNLFKYLKDHSECKPAEYLARLDLELNVINSKGYADYMLIMKNLMQWCESQDIPTGPGRGSAAGSLCLFVNRITKCVDPIKYGLLFSRFLTMDRKDLPDIDSDFSFLKRDRVIQHLKDTYGEECVSFISNNVELGVKNGLKDIGRVLNIPFSVMNGITAEIDLIINEAPSISFKDLDNLKNEDEIAYNRFKVLEQSNAKLFKIARELEGSPRNQGVHASGVLITPMPISDIFPVRYNDGSQVVMYTGPQVESIGGVKLDILGLKTLDVLDLTVKSVHPEATIYQLYDTVDNYLSNEEMFASLNRKETEGIFQLESNMFKGLISEIPQTNIDDITVLTSLGRPGPLSAGLHTELANRKKGESPISEPLPGTMHIVEDSMGVLVYQEHTMRISQVVAGFNDSQADSFLRKAQAKKKKSLMELCDQWFVYGKINEEPPIGYNEEDKDQPFYDPKGKYGDPIKGGIANGYDKKELKDYCKKIEGFCSYLFNKSHASCYSFLSCCTMYCKTFYKTQFFASLMSLQTKQEKIDLYCRIAGNYGIEIKAPDINLSNEFFTAKDKTILYGLGSVKGVGDAAIPNIIANRPYKDINDAYTKIGKKSFNKKVGEALIKVGAFDFINENRNALLNEYQTIRKAKKEEAFDELGYSESVCIQYEQDLLGTAITYKPFWDTVLEGETITVYMTIDDIIEKVDKRGGLMANLKVTIEKCKVDGIVFASLYSKNIGKFSLAKEEGSAILAKIKKDDKGKFILSSLENKPPKKMQSKTNPGGMINSFSNIIESLTS